MSFFKKIWKNRVLRFVALAVSWLFVVMFHYSLVLRTEPPIGQVPDQWRRINQQPQLPMEHEQQRQQEEEKEEMHPERIDIRAVVREEQRKQRKVQALKAINRTFDEYTFNGIPVTFQAGVTPASRTRCIHDDPLDDSSWISRSCMYQNLCLNIDTKEYVVFTDDDSNGNVNATAVALGGINPRWTNRGFNMGIWKVRWTPKKQQQTIPGYYALPDDAIWIPFHSLAAHNIGHLLWDDFYPIFSLLQSFELQHSRLLLPMRHQIADSLYANCDIRPNKRQQCKHNLDRFLPLLGVDPAHFSTTKRATLNIRARERRSPYVCARHAVAGLGLLTDHGWHDHGWNGQGHRPHNLARGPTFRAFGDFIVQNVLGGLPPLPPPTPVRVVFSTLSSRYVDRRLDFAVQLSYLRQSDVSERMKIDDRSLWQLSLEDQIRLARETHIFVTSCGGGVMTATFLPPGAALLVYYNPTGGYEYKNGQSELTGGPARLDWDLFNNAGHLRVHWLPITSMNATEDLELLGLLLKHEADAISRQAV